jgi:hypothetical protein
MDNRNFRELLIAFTAIITTWSIACAVFAARLLFGYEVEPFDGPAAMIADWLALHGVATP